MVTFLDKEVVVATLLGLFTIFLLINSQRKANQALRVNLFFKVTIALVILAPFIAMYYQKSKALENINYFKTKAPLKCEIENKGNYLVSKASGWSTYKEYYFIKESLLIRADSCETEQ